MPDPVITSWAENLSYAELHRLLPTDTEAAIVTTVHMERIAKRLLAAVPKDMRDHYEKHSGKKFSDLQFEFFLQDEPEASAFISSRMNPSPVSMSKGLWALAASEDEVAAVLSHELNHKLIGYVANHKAEEAMCDLGIIRTLRAAGYQEDALSRFFERLKEKRPQQLVHMEFLATVKDPHPNLQNRILALGYASEMDIQKGIVEDASGNAVPVKDSRSTAGKAATPKPAEVEDSFGKSKFRTLLQRRLDTQGYQSLAPAEKLVMLSGEMDTIAKDAEAGMGQKRSYAAGCIAEELKAIADTGYRVGDNAQDRKVFNRVVDQVVSFSGMVTPHHNAQFEESLHKCYGSLGVMDNKITGEDLAKLEHRNIPREVGLLGNMEAMSRAQERLVNASTIEEARAAASEVVGYHAMYINNTTTRNIADMIREKSSNFSRPSSEEISRQHGASYQHIRENFQYEDINEAVKQTPGIVPTWHQHAQWARQSPEIALSLWAMGVQGPDYPTYPMHDTWEIRQYAMKAGVRHHDYTVYGMLSKGKPDYHYNRKGEIVLDSEMFGSDLNDTLEEHRRKIWEPSTLNRAPRLLRRDSAEADIIARGDEEGGWKSDFDKIATSRYKEAAWSNFLDKYRHQLTPELRCSYYKGIMDTSAYGDAVDASKPPQGRKFIEAFLAHAKEKMKADPDIYVPLMREFMLSDYHGYQLPKLISASEAQIRRYETGKSADTYKISHEHPYAQFVLENPSGIFDGDYQSAAKKFIGEHVYYYDYHSADPLVRNRNPVAADGHLDPDRGWNLNPWQYNDAQKPETIEQARHNLTRMNLGGDHGDLGASMMLTNIHCFHHHAMQQGCSAHDMRMIVRLAEPVAKLQKTRSDTKLAVVTEKMLQLAEVNLQKLAQTNAPLEQWVEHYKTYDAIGVFAQKQEMKQQFEVELEARLKLAPVEQRQEAAQKLLLTEDFEVTDNTTNNVSLYFKDRLLNVQYQGAAPYIPKFRELLIDQATDGYARVTGKEEPNAVSQDKIKKCVEEICKGARGRLREEVLWEFAEKAETQRDTTHFIKEYVAEGYKASYGGEVGRYTIGGLEALHGHLVSTSERQRATLEFLSSPFTDQSAKKFLSVADLPLAEHNFSGKVPDSLKSLSSEQNKIATLRMMHGYYVASNDTTRIGIVAAFLFPDGDANFEQNKQYVFDRAFPVEGLDTRTPEGKQRLKDNIFIRDAMDRLMANSMPEGGPNPDYNRLLLSAIFAGSANSGEKTDYTNLFRAVQKTGALGKKFVQALNSYPNISDEIRQATKASKTDSDPPTRAELWRLIDEYGPTTPIVSRAGEVVGKQYEGHLGKRLGAASTAVVADIFQPDIHTEREACKILLPGLLEQAQRQYQVYDSTLEHIVKDYPHIAPAQAINRQAMRSLKIEVDTTAAGEQKRVAGAQSHGFEVKVEGQRVRFETVARTRVGQTFECTALATGEHFNDLPHGTPEQQDLRWKVATAMTAKELYLRMAGLPVDHDRHGGQQRIAMETDKLTGESVIVVREYDHGGQAVVPPTNTEKRLIFGALSRAVQKTKGDNGRLGAMVVSEFGRVAKRNPAMEDVASEQIRDVLSIQDYMRVASERPGTVEAVAAAIYKSDNVDPVIDEQMWLVRNHLQKNINASDLPIDITAPEGIASMHTGREKITATGYATLKVMGVLGRVDDLSGRIAMGSNALRTAAYVKNGEYDKALGSSTSFGVLGGVQYYNQRLIKNAMAQEKEAGELAAKIASSLNQRFSGEVPADTMEKMLKTALPDAIAEAGAGRLALNYSTKQADDITRHATGLAMKTLRGDVAEKLGRDVIAKATVEMGEGATKLASKRIPLVGALVTGGFTLWATGSEALRGNGWKAGSEFFAGSAETVGNLVGLGDVTRQLFVETQRAAGVENVGDDAGAVMLAKMPLGGIVDIRKGVLDEGKIRDRQDLQNVEYKVDAQGKEMQIAIPVVKQSLDEIPVPDTLKQTLQKVGRGDNDVEKAKALRRELIKHEQNKPLLVAIAERDTQIYPDDSQSRAQLEAVADELNSYVERNVARERTLEAMAHSQYRYTHKGKQHLEAAIAEQKLDTHLPALRDVPKPMVLDLVELPALHAFLTEHGIIDGKSQRVTMTMEQVNKGLGAMADVAGATSIYQLFMPEDMNQRLSVVYEMQQFMEKQYRPYVKQLHAQTGNVVVNAHDMEIVRHEIGDKIHAMDTAQVRLEAITGPGSWKLENGNLAYALELPQGVTAEALAAQLNSMAKLDAAGAHGMVVRDGRITLSRDDELQHNVSRRVMDSYNAGSIEKTRQDVAVLEEYAKEKLPFFVLRTPDTTMRDEKAARVEELKLALNPGNDTQAERRLLDASAELHEQEARLLAVRQHGISAELMRHNSHTEEMKLSTDALQRQNNLIVLPSRRTHDLGVKARVHDDELISAVNARENALSVHAGRMDVLLKAIDSTAAHYHAEESRRQDTNAVAYPGWSLTGEKQLINLGGILEDAGKNRQIKTDIAIENGLPQAYLVITPNNPEALLALNEALKENGIVHQPIKDGVRVKFEDIKSALPRGASAFGLLGSREDGDLLNIPHKASNKILGANIGFRDS